MTREGARGFAALDHRIPPPVIGALIAGLMWVAAGASPTLGVPPSLLRPLAVVLGVVALGIDSAARLAPRPPSVDTLGQMAISLIDDGR